MRLVPPPHLPALRLDTGGYTRSHGFAPRSQDPTQPAVANPAYNAPGAQAVDTNLIGRTSLGLMVIIGVILLCGYLLKRLGPFRQPNNNSLAVVASHSVGYRERVVIVDVEDQRLVLGVTASNINKLHELEAPPRPAGTAQRTQPSFAEALSRNLRQASARFTARHRS